MSIEPEDSLLEQALRGDLPSPDVEARLRRRLLAAGVAIGNGMATTTAAAGSAASGSAATSLVAKVAGLSWGVKLGLAAVVTIPTLGLWLDGRGQHRAAQQSTVVAPAHAAEPQTERGRALPTPATPAVRPASEPATAAAEHGAGKQGRAGAAEAPLPPSNDDASPAHPSQGDFGAPEPPARAPQAPSTLAEETRILDGAFAALAAGDHARAALLIQEHEARYPNGLLQKERERAKLRLSEMSRGE